MSSSIRISKNTYKKLVELAGVLQAKLKRKVSIDEAINFLIEGKSLPGKVTELSGAWDITDEEVEEIFNDLKKGWEKWSIKKFA